MMIEFNLLPDVKMQYIKARAKKRFAMVASILVSGTAVALLVLLFLAVQVFQKSYLNDLTADIKKESEELKNIPDLNKVLTLQSQLKSLDSLHGQKPQVSRLFGYLQQITPSDVGITEVALVFSENKMTIRGVGQSATSANRFVDTLKFTNYKVSMLDEKGEQKFNSQGEPEFEVKRAFSKVVLSAFNVTTAPELPNGPKDDQFSVTLQFEPILFDNTKNVVLEIPKGMITTRSEIEKPGPLFIESIKSEGTEE